MSRNILILCTGNSCRSQIAEGYFRKYLPEDKIYSAGLEAHGLNPLAVKVMAEDGVDISKHISKTMDTLDGMSWDVVITVCDHAYEQCPFIPGNHQKLHKAFPDPAKAVGSIDEVLQAFRDVRDAIQSFAQQFAESSSQSGSA